MNHPLLEKLLAGGPVITDGATGTQLQAKGLAPGECPDSWNLLHPKAVEGIARAYVEAGSQIVLTNTFRANRQALAGQDLGEKVEEINRRGVEIARRAAAGQAAVFGSMGPGGKMLMTGEVSEEELRSAFEEQARVLAEAGVEGFAVETMTDLAEAKLAVAAARQTGLPVVVSMVFDSGKERDRTMMGVTPEQAAEELTAAGADVVGSNCGRTIQGFVPLCRRLHSATDRPIWIKPNAGLPEWVEGKLVYPTPPREFAGVVPMLVEAGASFVGGCCGTTPEFIAAIKERMRTLRAD
jgi:5-methyltetrahydrofolate--homocysteine methyltransferase